MRRSASLLDLRRRCAAARRGIRGVLPVLSSSSPVVDVTLGGALPPRRRRGRASRGGLRGGRRQPRAGRRRGAGGGAAASEGCCAPLLGLSPVVGLLDLEQNVAAAPPRRAVPGHAQAGRAMLKPAVRRRGREAGRASSWARSRPRWAHASSSGCAIPGTTCRALPPRDDDRFGRAHQLEEAFDLPTLVLDEVQTLSAVCEERYRVSLPMRGARAFSHESKTFRERQRET